MSTARMSIAPGAHQRRVTSLLPSTAAGSGAGPSSSRAFSFRPHALLSQHGGAAVGGDGNIGETSSMGAAAATAAAPSLDYTALTNRIEAFKELFVAHLNATATAMHEAQAEHVHNTHEAQRTLESVRDHIERQKNEQKALYQAVAAERQAEGSAQTQLSQLQASRASLAQRLAEAEAERDKLQAVLDRKARSREARRHQLTVQVKRNKPELLRFNEKLGCRVSAGGDKAGRNKSVIKFTFNLFDPSDWSREANFVIDASKAQYQIVSHTPAIPSATLTGMVDELNTTRALFVFIKKMRAAFKEQIERERRRGTK